MRMYSRPMYEKHNLPRFISIDRKGRKPYKVSVYHDNNSHFVGNYVTLGEAIVARDKYCRDRNVAIVERECNATTS